MKLYTSEKIAIGLAVGFFVVFPILFTGLLLYLDL
jgi:hypothetical protein